LGTSSYGHSADCPTSKILLDETYYFCGDSYILGPINKTDSTTFFGDTIWIEQEMICCPAPAGACKQSLTINQSEVDVGEFGGAVNVAVEGGLPLGYKLEASAEVKYNNKTTKEISLTGVQECSNPADSCTKHVSKVGPGYKTRTYTFTYSHICWGQLVPECNLGVSLNMQVHGSAFNGQASLTYLAVDIFGSMGCNQGMSEEEEDEECGCDTCPE
jgi:hypothetical protein